MDFAYLLDEYRKIWNNRQLAGGSGLNDEETLKEAISRELKDENSHPRVRRLLFEKYYLATKRIVESPLSDEDKVKLIQLHTEISGELK